MKFKPSILNNRWPSRNLIGLATFGKPRAYSAYVAGVFNTKLSGAAFDSHANVTLVSDKNHVSDYKPISNFSIDGIGGVVQAIGIGTLKFAVKCKSGKNVELKLKNVLVVPDCTRKCIICADDFVNIKEVSKCVLNNGGNAYVKLKNGEQIQLKRDNKLYGIDIDIVAGETKKRKRDITLSSLAATFSSVFTSKKNNTSIEHAHAVLCHPSKQKMSIIKRNNLIRGLTWSEDTLQRPCFPCAIGRSHLSAKIRNKEPSVANKRGDRIFTDIEGPIAVPGFGGVRYAVHFTDSYSRFTVTYFMKQKSDVHHMLMKYVNEYCKPNNVLIKKIQADAENVYIGPKSPFRAICNKLKILLTSSSPYSHWENGVAERVIRTFMEKAFTLMAQRDLSSQHWAHALEHVFKVNNCLPHSSINNETPYWRWYESVPEFGNVHTFGCDVRVNVPTELNPRKYVDPPGYMALYIGFNYDSSAHKIFKPNYGGQKYEILMRGDRQCLFFELYDENLFLKQHDDPAYKEYFKNNSKDPSFSGGDTKQNENSVPIRIAKEFFGVVHYGTAVKNSGNTQYVYDVSYDDGDFETFTETEFQKAVSLFESQPDSIQKQSSIETDEIGIEVLQGRNKIIQVLKHKTITQNGVSYACLKVKLKNKSVQKTQWVQAGSILALSGKDYISNNWGKVHDYVDKHKHIAGEFLFKYYTTTEPSARTKRRDQKYKVFGAIHDDTEENVLCVYPDGTYKEIPCIKLRTAVVNSMTTEIGRDSYVPTDYPEVQKMNETVWLKAVEDCILSTINVAKTGRWVKLKDVKVKTISSRFVFQVKYRVKDNKYEAFCRWTPRGFDETPGEHYDPEHIFAGTPQLGVLRYILTKALYTGQSTFHFDFKRAFPSTPLDRVIYVKTPKGYTHYDEDGDECCIALDKSAEGLKQSGANWLDMLTLFLKNIGFKQSVTEPKLFSKDVIKEGKKAGTCDIMIYIDDVIGTCCCDDFVLSLLKDFNEKLGIVCNNLGEVKHALGITVERDGDDISIHQSQKIRDLLIKYDMLDCAPRTVPIQTNFKLNVALDGEKLCDAEKQKYQSIVGSFLWINRGTRPDISEATWILARGMSSPTKELLDAAWHCLRYLKGTMDRKLTYSHTKNSSLDLKAYDYNPAIPTGFCDSNWDVPVSQSCNLIMFCNGALMWSTKRQDSTALSTVQAELCALSEQAVENKYCTLVFEFLDMKFTGPLPIFCDNKGAIQNAKHPTTKNKLKHVDIKCFFIRECIDRKIVSVFKILGTENPADVGTKLLGSLKFNMFSFFMMNIKDITKKVYVSKKTESRDIDSRRRVKFGLKYNQTYII